LLFLFVSIIFFATQAHPADCELARVAKPLQAGLGPSLEYFHLQPYGDAAESELVTALESVLQSAVLVASSRLDLEYYRRREFYQESAPTQCVQTKQYVKAVERLCDALVASIVSILLEFQ
jgi:hypothetical protein